MELNTDFFERTAKVLTVAELTRAIRGTLDVDRIIEPSLAQQAASEMPA